MKSNIPERFRKHTIENREAIFKFLSLNISPVIENMREILIKFSEITFDIRRHLTESGFYESLARFKEGWIETQEDLKVFKSLMVELGYPPHDEIDIPNMRAIAHEYKKNNSTIDKELTILIEDFLFEFYKPERLKQISLEWEHIDYVKERIPILRNIIMAHNLGMYNVSIPTALTQLEGVLVDMFHIKGNVNGKIIRILLHHLLINENNSSAFSFDLEIHNYYAKNILVQFKHGDYINSKISRNAILHGGDKDYGELANSLKIILLLDYIICAGSELTDEQRSLAKKSVKDSRRRDGKSKLRRKR